MVEEDLVVEVEGEGEEDLVVEEVAVEVVLLVVAVCLLKYVSSSN